MLTKNTMAKRMKCLLHKRRRREEMGGEKKVRGDKKVHTTTHKRCYLKNKKDKINCCRQLT